MLKSMATIHSTPALPRTPAPILSAQPGGGFFMSLELAWGKFRRRLLRRFRPGYVRQMFEKRQGQCPDCPHDIIDPRDLKYFRNVCGYWFCEEDDAFRWRGRLRLARAGLAELIGFSLMFAVLTSVFVVAGWYHAAFWLPLPLVLAAWLFVLAFFRDPERSIPSDADALLSPADGTITDVGEVDEPDFPGGRAFRIGIFLSVFNVHINRVPRSGRVVALRYFPGYFLDARNPACGVSNEQLWIDLEDGGTGRPIRVKQIAGAIARRIVCWLKPGEQVHAGARLGMIKFGSRTELYLPAGEAHELAVKAGDVVHGGSSILLRFKRT
jgi:phosphatidylserine decarboxylase